jgi:two-component system, NarL family, response regulator
VIDDHPLLRLGVREALGDGFEVHESASREEGLDLIRDVGSFDVAVVDVRPRANGGVPTLGGAEAIRAMRRAEPGLGIVAHGGRPERHLASAAFGAGATAYLARTAAPEEVRKAVEAALAERSFIDPAVPPKGESTTAAARELGLSEETVKTHTKNLLARLAARNRTHAVAIALRESLID